MKSVTDFAKGITEMADNCPFNGNVTATFAFHAGNVCGINITTEELDSEACKEDIKVFTPTIVKMLMYKLDKKKQYYGSVTVIISVKNGRYYYAEFLVSEKVSLGQAQALVRTESNRQAA